MAICQDRPFHLYGYIRLIKIVVRIFGLLLIGVIIYLNWGYNQKPQNYQDCAGLKDSVISLTYPQTCTARDGQRFIQKIYEKLTISPSAPTITSQPDNCCSQIQLQQGYECLQGCGGPHVRKNDPTPAYSCLNPTQAYSRKTFGCPICLASNTYISTPQGSVKVIDLKVGMPVWSVDKEGNKISVPILRLTKTRTPQNHRVTRLILSDGRRLDVSPNHPDISGNPVSLLQPGNLYDKSVVLENTLFPYWDSFTYDLLPDSETGFYFANGIPMASTINLPSLPLRERNALCDHGLILSQTGNCLYTPCL
ncbi:hypothetical protein A3D03_04285 [Candidatus Gottesmanbacteria bacterium RIFCSPHIGHO2_02_FULL_40_13]|uniref:Hint domain-containing protein n=1 Tax=Candidatus Gottesmanbacteria bacterium RIFCSPHIGHO2_02_FULL_40_13 TaxID=1798384 RepID=A0A1F6A8B9_9BACT|nr:MAG: hypothetical protein A3D03_04285 [Candidatus Gottesmanbacteria bacterium RIFCSPHIGHO2_02_FULL_40_13]